MLRALDVDWHSAPVARLFPCGIVLRRSIPSRHETAPEHGSGTLDVDEGG